MIALLRVTVKLYKLLLLKLTFQLFTNNALMIQNILLCCTLCNINNNAINHYYKMLKLTCK